MAANVTPDHLWRRLSTAVAARRSMRLYDPTTRKYGAAGVALTAKRPALPAAVPLFSRGRARVVALDFDAKVHGSAAVVADVARVLAWLTECGARAVVDVSSSGGRHVLIPLAPGQSVTVDEIRPVLRQLGSRLQTLDITPMTNAATGCITVPGSQCKEGGHRRLVDLDADTALDILTVGSDPGALTRLEALLGGVRRTITRSVDAHVHASTLAERIIDTGDDARLHPRFCRTGPASASVTAFAAAGTLDPARWLSRSEARQSVIAHAVLSGATTADILARAASPGWAGFRAAYADYAEPARAIRRDTARALDWAASTLPDPVRDTGHKQKHTGGTHDPVVASWVTHAHAWVTTEFSQRRDRWTTHAVIQGLAWAAAVSGRTVEGVPTVGVGGRSLSIAAGMLPESTVWSILERLREMEGSPLLLIERGVGQNPDRYALVPTAAERQKRAGRRGEDVLMQPGWVESLAADSGGTDSVEVESVHPAWSVIGWRHRMLYDAVSTAGTPLTAEELFTRVRIGRTSGYEALVDLRIAGLIVVDDGVVTAGPVELDDIGHRHGLSAAVRARTVRHRAERIVWREWLEAREDAHTPPTPAPSVFWITESGVSAHGDADHGDADYDGGDHRVGDFRDEDYLAAVLDSGPPPGST